MIKKLRRNLKLNLSFVKRKFIKPKYPNNKDGKVLLHIGCGKKNSPEFINIDALPMAHIHIVTDDIASLKEFDDSTADLIYMCHVLEHIKKKRLMKVLYEMKRLLKVGGVLRLSVPDFDKLIDAYNDSDKNINVIDVQLMGGQDSDYNIHYSIFNHNSLSDLLYEVGFKTITTWNPSNCEFHNFKDRSSRKININGREHFISLNLEAAK